MDGLAIGIEMQMSLVGRTEGSRRNRGWIRMSDRERLVQQHKTDDAALQTGSQILLGDDNGDARVREHEGESLLREGRVERQIGAAGLENAQQADDHLQRAFHANTHEHVWANAQFAQLLSELIGTAM